MGGKTSTTTQKTELPPDILAAYNGLIAKATPLADTAYKPYTGGVGGSGFQQNQLTGFDTIAGLKGASDPAFGAAGADYMKSAVPSYADVGKYMNPYVQNVVNATQANMNESNAEQQQGVIGNAAALGALGGNRVGVAQSELARQQNLANQQTIANLYSQGYSGAMSADQADKGLQQNAAQGLTSLGQTQMQTDLAQAAAQVGAGTQQQQWDYQQYQNALSYPFQSTSWLANIVEGLGAGRGTTTTTQPSGNTASSVLGGVLGIASLFGKGGVAHAREAAPAPARPRYATGGIIPYTGPSGIIAANNNQPAGANDNGTYVPQAQAASGAIGPAHPAPPPQQPDQGDQMLQMGINAEEKNLKKQFPNGILAGRPAPMQGPTLSGAPLGGASGGVGLLSKLGGLFGFADGGGVRGYDGGGVVFPMTGRLPMDPDAQQALLDRMGGPIPVAAVKTDRLPSLDTQAADARLNLPNPPMAAPPLDPPVNVPTLKVAGVAPDAGQGVAANIPVPVPTPRPYVDPRVVTGTGVAPAADSGVAPAAAPRSPIRVTANQPIYDGFMNTVRAGVTNPYGLAAVASTGIHESGFSAGNAFRTWQDGENRAGGIMSWNGPRLARMQAFVKDNGGDPSRPSPELQGAFFLHENPGLIARLNAAKSPQEAQAIMNAAWQFRGWNQPGNHEVASRTQQAVALAPQFSGTTSPAGSDTAPAWANTAVAMKTAPTGVDTATTGSTARPGTGVLGGSGSVDGAPAPTHMGGILGNVGNFLSGKGGHLLNLSDDQRMALLSAGLGMMAGTSPHFAQNVGTGGLKGIETWQAQQRQNRENAQASSEINTRSADVAQRGQQLAIDASRAGSEINLQSAQAGHENLATQTGRWQQTVTPAGIIVRDMTNPNAPPRLTTWEDIQKNGAPPELTSNEQIGAGASGGQGAPEAKPAAAPVTAPNNAPVTAAPTQPVAAQFVTQAPAHIPIDPRVMSPTGQQIVTAETTEANKTARDEYQGAASARTQIAEMKHDLDAIDNSAWTTPGTGFPARVAWAKGINTTFQAMGIDAPINTDAVAAGEDLNKLSTRLGFDLSKTLGSREAATVVDQAVSAVPGGYNSKEGARRILAGIEAGNQRKMDYYTFLQDWQSRSGGSIKGADDYFNRLNPPEKYANQALLSIATVPQSQADIDRAPKGTMFNIDGQLMVK